MGLASLAHCLQLSSLCKVPWKLEDIPLSNFDEILQRFFAELKTCKGEDYDPDSLRTMLGALNCHLRDSGCAHRINDEKFLGAKRVLNGKAIDLREKGKGKKKRKADQITDEEEEQIKCGQQKYLGLNHHAASTSLCGTY